jgi:leader peptidase (prepilin peptidase) / N-methyltransferase
VSSPFLINSSILPIKSSARFFLKTKYDFKEVFTTLLSSILVGVYGLTFGSFYTVVIDRSLSGQSIIFPRSYCPHCINHLKFFDLIPLISYFLLRGKCRYCKKKISPLYPFIEAITATGFILLYVHSSTLSTFLIGSGLFSLLLIVTITDIQSMIIPDKVLIVFLIYFFVIKCSSLAPDLFVQNIMGALLGLLCPFCVWVFYRQGLGIGDIKLFGLLGFVLGSHLIFLCITLSCIFGILSFLSYAVIWKAMLRRKCHENRSGPQKLIPFAPFISIGALIAYFWG